MVEFIRRALGPGRVPSAIIDGRPERIREEGTLWESPSRLSRRAGRNWACEYSNEDTISNIRKISIQTMSAIRVISIARGDEELPAGESFRTKRISVR